ncbi:hypothetical protein I316_04991 [Kwoniella heveanensis BCC8398]|uniref:Zn(2)-C6 fungal-type domain-containing protein n=1 Tax=Kwoniella heveanensis BCC8398 TaxID=1296120 RepID=A0A1B9GQA6_9TREE|nr:hypothetical protein I316_04991 [Kwoniella heveanensis BCC8398]
MQRYHPYPTGANPNSGPDLNSGSSSAPFSHANVDTNNTPNNAELYIPIRNGGNNNNSLYPPGSRPPGAGEMDVGMSRVKSEGYEGQYRPYPYPAADPYPSHDERGLGGQTQAQSQSYTRAGSNYPPPGGGMSMDDTAIGSSLGKRKNLSDPRSGTVTPSTAAGSHAAHASTLISSYLSEEKNGYMRGQAGGSGQRAQVGGSALASGSGSGGAVSEGKIKKTRQSPCRARKVKCDRPPPGSSNPSVSHKDICSHCEHLGLACTFDYKPKKRGPPNMYMRRLQGESGSGPSGPRSGSVTPVSGSPQRAASHPLPSIIDPAFGDGSEQSVQAGPSGQYEGDRDRWADHLAAVSSRLGGAGDNPPYTGPPPPPSSLPYMGSRSANSSPVSRHQFLPPVTQQQPNLPQGASAFVYPPSHQHAQATQPNAYTPPSRLHNFAQAHNPYPSPQVSPSVPRPVYMYVDHPYNPSNPIDAILPRSTLHQILDLFFDYIYCLIPCVHRPSFTHDINTKREERAGQEEWTSLVLIIVASTLVQLPRSFVSMSRKQVRELVIACYNKVKDYLNKDFDQITVDRTIIVYHCLFVTRMMGKMVVGKGDLGMNYSYLLALRAHEEKSYALLNPLERALQRRAFWVTYGADVSIAAIEGSPVFFHEDDCADVAYPEEIDDEYISEQGILPQPEGHTSALSGFHYISRLHRITGQYLDKYRRDKRKPPSGLLLQMRLNEVNELYERTMSLMDHCPPPLRLEYRTGSKSVQSLSPGWDAKAKEDILAIFSDPNFDTEIVKDFYLVQQANIYVSQQMVRLMILQYRDELLGLQQDSPADNMSSGSIVGAGAGANNGGRQASGGIQSHGNGGGSGELTSSSEKDEVVIDLLAILQKIPLKVLAVNSFPIVSKVQVIASTLLDALDNNGDNTAPPTLVPTVIETRAQKAQRNLWQFLNILSEIEGLYSLTDD